MDCFFDVDVTDADGKLIAAFEMNGFGRRYADGLFRLESRAALALSPVMDFDRMNAPAVLNKLGNEGRD